MGKSQTILITGATCGIGRHAALYLARRGHRVIATGRNLEALATLKAEAPGAALDVVRLDVTSAASIEAAVAEVDRLTDGRGLDVLVNNAGYGVAVATAEISDADLRAQFDTNVFGLVAVTRAFVPAMRARGRGRVINVSSIGGRVTLPLFGAYNATKYAVEALSNALRYELKPFGIEVSVIEPGAIRTNFATRTVAEGAAYFNADSPYAPVYARYDVLRKKADEFAPGPQVISRAIERAATAWRPRARYVAPFSGHFILALFALLPTRVIDWTMRLALGLTRKKLSAATARRSTPPALAPAPVAK